jgi:hypothetical protein
MGPQNSKTKKKSKANNQELQPNPIQEVPIMYEPSPIITNNSLDLEEKKIIIPVSNYIFKFWAIPVGKK